MLRVFTAELSMRKREFVLVARTAVVAVPAPVRVAGRLGVVEGSGSRSLPRPDP
ncbi:hypothetical protein [Streptomyces canus]|uniref:Uncharacterized protein n=1 Tax=Streptomyces canus TaxID=58343 RepID=A0AAW8FUH0_9ACTN|nr:hypothetical protein [Streptomyces canus]MDQ0912990.1 hypothetical protein [Streptomyces canus]MDQ1072977.1 hypothetical protein [Streptomyces canus]